MASRNATPQPGQKHQRLLPTISDRNESKTRPASKASSRVTTPQANKLRPLAQTPQLVVSPSSPLTQDRQTGIDNDGLVGGLGDASRASSLSTTPRTLRQSMTFSDLPDDASVQQHRKGVKSRGSSRRPSCVATRSRGTSFVNELNSDEHLKLVRQMKKAQEEEHEEALRQEFERRELLQQSTQEKLDERKVALQQRGKRLDEHRERVLSARERIAEEELQRMLDDHERREHHRDEAFDGRHNPMADHRIVEQQGRVKAWLPLLIFALSSYRWNERVVRERAFSRLITWMRPVCYRKVQILRHRKMMAKLTEELVPSSSRPTIELLRGMKQQGSSFFENWTDAECVAFIKKLSPRCFREGDLLLTEGDMDRSMLLVTEGKMKVLIRDAKKNRCKRRDEANSIAVIPIKGPTYIGEFALLTKERRSATVKAASDCYVWQISAEDFQELNFSSELKRHLEDVADERRLFNMKKFFPPTIESLQQLPALADWNVHLLTKLQGAMDPNVIRAGQVACEVGSGAPVKLFFLKEGVCDVIHGSFADYRAADQQQHNRLPLNHQRVDSDHAAQLADHEALPSLNHTVTLQTSSTSDPDNQPIAERKLPTFRKETVGDQSWIGVFEAFHNGEKQEASIVVVKKSEIWSIERSKLLDVAMSAATSLMETRSVLRSERANDIKPVPPIVFTSNPLVQHALQPRNAAFLWEHATPTVFASGDYLCREGEELPTIGIIVSGNVSVRYGSTGFLSGATEELSATAAAKLAVGSGTTLAHQPAKFVASQSHRGTISVGLLELLSDNERALSTVRARTTVEVLVIERNSFEDLIPPQVMRFLKTPEAISKLTKAFELGTVKTFVSETTPSRQTVQKSARRRSPSAVPSSENPSLKQSASRPATKSVLQHVNSPQKKAQRSIVR